MASQFDQAFELSAAPQLDNWFGATVKLKRDALESDSFTAVWSSQEFKSYEHETGLSIVVRRRVYRFLKTDSVLAGDTLRPRAGDFIVDGDDELKICPMDGKPAVEEEPGGYRWLVRTDKLA